MAEILTMRANLFNLKFSNNLYEILLPIRKFRRIYELYNPFYYKKATGQEIIFAFVTSIQQCLGLRLLCLSIFMEKIGRIFS